MNTRSSIRWLWYASLVLLLGTAPAHANLWTVTGSTSDGPVDATAVVTVAPAGGSLTVTLTNLETNPQALGQLLSAVILTVSDTSNPLGLSSGAGTLRTVHGDQSFSDTTLAANQAGWVLSQSGNTISLDVLSGSGHAGPAHMIIGDPGGATYSAANSSIAEKGSKTPHNPFIFQSETWTISGSSITSSTQITGVAFQFGATDGQNLLTGQDPPAVPEPSTLALGGLGALGLLGYAMRRRMTMWLRPAQADDGPR